MRARVKTKTERESEREKRKARYQQCTNNRRLVAIGRIFTIAELLERLDNLREQGNSEQTTTALLTYLNAHLNLELPACRSRLCRLRNEREEQRRKVPTQKEKHRLASASPDFHPHTPVPFRSLLCRHAGSFQLEPVAQSLQLLSIRLLYFRSRQGLRLFLF